MTEFIAEKIEYRDLDSLIPHARNSRKHSDAQVSQIAASMKEWGWTNPVLIDESNTILAGHGRVLAAKKLGIKSAPVIVADGWSDEKKRAYIIADNKISENSSWDHDLLKLELSDLGDFDVSILGFTEHELGRMLDGSQSVDGEDDVPDRSDTQVSQPGQIWKLGNHRIMCGSSTDKDNVSSLLGDIKPHLMVTDPPYGVEYDASWRNKVQSGNSCLANGKVLNDDIADWSAAYDLFPGDVAYVWHASLMAKDFIDSLQRSGFEIRSNIIWVKNKILISRGHYHFQHEPCLYAVRKGKTASWTGDRKQSTVWNIDKPLKSETGHSTQKPVECMRRPIINNSSPGQAIYEPFSGSGTTIIAAELTGRHCYAMEINPAYVDIAVKRWQTITGDKAIDALTGRTFDSIAQ